MLGVKKSVEFIICLLSVPIRQVSLTFFSDRPVFSDNLVKNLTKILVVAKNDLIFTLISSGDLS